MNYRTPILIALASACLGLCACGSGSAGHGDLGQLQHLAEQCGDGDLAAYVAVDFSDTARSDSLALDRRAAISTEAERVAVCGGSLKVVAFTSSTASAWSMTK